MHVGKAILFWNPVVFFGRVFAFILLYNGFYVKRYYLL